MAITYWYLVYSVSYKLKYTAQIRLRAYVSQAAWSTYWLMSQRDSARSFQWWLALTASIVSIATTSDRSYFYETSDVIWQTHSNQSRSDIVYYQLVYRVSQKNRTFLRYHIFAATTDIIMRFMLKCSEIIVENNKRQFFKRVLNIFCKVTGNGLCHSWRCQSTYQCYQFGQFFVVNYTTLSLPLSCGKLMHHCDQHSSHFQLAKP